MLLAACGAVSGLLFPTAAWLSISSVSLPHPSPTRLAGFFAGSSSVIRTGTLLTTMSASGTTPVIPATAAGGKRPLRRLIPSSSCTNLRVYSISDIHVDYKRNLEWWYEWCDKLKAERGTSYDIVLLPGDVSSNIETFRSALVKAKECFDAVVIAIGNHDLWVSSNLSARGIKTSIDKLEAIRGICRELDVQMDPVCVRTPEGRRVFLAPLYSWYHASWDSDPDLPAEAVAVLYEGRPSFTDRWSDFRFCKWPEEVIRKEDFVSTTTTSTRLADHFAAMNDEVLSDTELSAEARLDTDVVISLSHYVPRMELCPEKRFLIEPSLTKVIGSDPLERQVRLLKPALHVFGHTHIPIDLDVKGVRYMQWPLGSVAEQKRQTGEMASKGPLLVFDELGGGLVKEVETHWGTYYKKCARDPLQCELAPWVLRFWGVEPFNDQAILPEWSGSSLVGNSSCDDNSPRSEGSLSHNHA